MTVPCGGTGVSEENETQSVKPGDYESSDSGAFCFSAVRSIFDCPPVLQNRIIKEQADGQHLSGFIDLNDYRQTASLSVGSSTEPFTTSSKPRFPTGRCSLRWISNSPDENGGENRLNKLSPWGWLECARLKMLGAPFLNYERI